MPLDSRRAPDLGDGTFLNPVLPGDRPDPSVLRVGDRFYLTYSSFDASPGLTVWSSPDLVNWTFVTCALAEPHSTVFAPDLVEHAGRYYIYFPYIPSAWSDSIRRPEIWVVHADSPEGPWSEPVFTGIAGAIDPGHIVGEDGERYLFLSGIRRCRLSADGLRAVTEPEYVYDGWHYPEEWVTEAYALEGPKLFRRGDWFYLVSAVGGTGGPPTGHMVIVARSRSIDGPWENAPANPIARTWSADEAWWSRGHATLVDVGDDSWWMISHGYENGFRTLGRQALLEPIEWSEDGWPHAAADDLGAPIRKPIEGSAPVAIPAPSDDFGAPAWGERWVFDNPARDELTRVRLEEGLVLRGKGRGPADSSPLTTWSMDRGYEVEVEVEVRDGSAGGLLLYFDDRLFYGMGWDGTAMQSYAGGIRTHWPEPAGPGAVIQLRLRNDHHIVTGWHRRPGEEWTRHGVRYDTSGAHSATINDLKSLRPALFASGDGEVVFRRFRYRLLDGGE